MKFLINHMIFLFRLVGCSLFLKWSYLLITMDSYLFSDPTSYLFWSTGVQRVLNAAFISSGLIISTLKIGQKHWILALILLVISGACSIFVVPEKGDWIFWIASSFIHGMAIFNLYKTRSIKLSLPPKSGPAE
jgi:hypothetical protein